MQPEAKPHIRLFVEDDLAAGTSVGLDRARSHYLAHVMRLARGDSVALFNGRDGEWRGRVETVARGWSALTVEERLRAQEPPADLWLVFAPIKRARIDFVAAKATELGVAALWPVFTGHTAVGRVNEERLRANAVEAAEQCGRTEVPAVFAARPLIEALTDWPRERRLMVCDPSGQPVAQALRAAAPTDGGQGAGQGAGPWAVLIGPEGGLTVSELDALAKLPSVTRVRLGRRILRADTAAVAALACWQAVLGDWQSGPHASPPSGSPA